jgi:hypothetical protein
MRREVRIHLTHIDYLRVHYKRSPFGLRKKAMNFPPVFNFQRHSNRIEIGVHFANALYWKLLPKSSCFLSESAHCNDVDSPTEVVVCQPTTSKPKKFDFPKVPTLYQISKAAFPKKWIWRKAINKEWTEAELMALELDEVRQKPGGWFERYGPKT